MNPPAPSPDYHNAVTMEMEKLKTILLGVLCCVLFLLVIVLLVLGFKPQLVRYYRRIKPINQKHVKRRMETIKCWTICKPIIDHSQCNVLRNCKSNDSSVLDCPKTDSCDTITNEEESSSVESDKMQCCGICMEPFQVNEEVSWSSTSECHHAFHPPCINAWLVGHIGCPLCRRMFMLVDDTPKRVSNEELVALSRIQKKRKKSTFFCIRDGLIVITDTVDLEKQQQNTNKVVTETRNVLCDGLTEVTRANHNEDSPDTQTSSMYPYDGSPNLQQRKASLPFRRVSSSDQCEKTTTLTSDNTTIFAKASTETALTTVSSTLSDL